MLIQELLQLNEILNTNTPLTTIRESNRFWSASATFGDREIEFRFAKWPPPNDNKWNFAFVELNNEDETFDATGNGNELAVFAAAKKFLEMAIQKYNPNAFFFEADKTKGSNRAKLYRKMIARWTPSGFEHQVVHSDEAMDYFAFFNKTPHYSNEDD